MGSKSPFIDILIRQAAGIIESVYTKHNNNRNEASRSGIQKLDW